MGVMISLFAVIALILLVFLGVGAAHMEFIFGIIFPYAAVIIFLAGIVYRVLKWADIPVPFRIPTTCGQQKSLPWIKASKIESPSTTFGVVVRMALEVLFFRSLFRNTKTELRDGPKLVYGSVIWLWLGGLAFHWSFLIIVVRHFKFFMEPVPSILLLIQKFDGFFQIGLPVIYITDGIILTALTYLFFRRVISPQIRYISLANDYFPLLLLLGIAISGVTMRYFYKVDVVSVKELAMGLIGFYPVIPEGIGLLFYIHLFLISVLLVYFPFSKLLHMAGVFLSPTRNLANNNRMRRHINPWDYPVKVHTYEEYEDEFRDVMRSAGLPLDKEK